MQADIDKNTAEKASSFSWIGHTYLFEQKFTETESYDQRVFDIFGKYGEPPQKLSTQALAMCLNDTAMMEYKNGAYDLAERDVRHAIKIKRSALGESSLAPNLAVLGLILGPKKNFKEAKAASDRSFKIMEGTLEPDSPEMAKYSELRDQVRGAARFSQYVCNDHGYVLART